MSALENTAKGLRIFLIVYEIFQLSLYEILNGLKYKLVCIDKLLLNVNRDLYCTKIQNTYLNTIDKIKYLKTKVTVKVFTF